MLKLSCSSTKPGDEAIPGTGACVGQPEPSVGGYRPIRARESWGAQLPGLRGVVNTQLGATGYTAQTGETLSSLTILCGCRLWGYTNVSQWGESVFNYDVVCCLKLTRYEMRRCLPTSGKSWGRWEKLDTRVDIWWWMIGRPYHWQLGAWAGS